MSSVLTFGQWGYPTLGLKSYGGAEEKKPSSMWLISEQVNEASGNPNYLT